MPFDRVSNESFRCEVLILDNCKCFDPYYDMGLLYLTEKKSLHVEIVDVDIPNVPEEIGPSSLRNEPHETC